MPVFGRDAISPLAASTLTASRTTVRLTSWSSRSVGTESPGLSSPPQDPHADVVHQLPVQPAAGIGAVFHHTIRILLDTCRNRCYVRDAAARVCCTRAPDTKGGSRGSRSDARRGRRRADGSGGAARARDGPAQRAEAGRPRSRGAVDALGRHGEPDDRCGHRRARRRQLHQVPSEVEVRVRQPRDDEPVLRADDLRRRRTRARCSVAATSGPARRRRTSARWSTRSTRRSRPRRRASRAVSST